MEGDAIADMRRRTEEKRRLQLEAKRKSEIFDQLLLAAAGAAKLPKFSH